MKPMCREFVHDVRILPLLPVAVVVGGLRLRDEDRRQTLFTLDVPDRALILPERLDGEPGNRGGLPNQCLCSQGGHDRFGARSDGFFL